MTEKAPVTAALVLALMVLGGAFIAAPDGAFAYDPAEFLPPHSAVPTDYNSDSVYETVKVYAGVRVIDAGSYTVEASFYQTFGIWMATSLNSSYLTPGDYSIETIFDGADLYDDHVNGTYYVDLKLYQENSTNYSTPIATTNFTAGDFTYDQFVEPTHIEMISDHGLDTDSDGLYNFLVVDVMVHVVLDWGFYNLGGTIPGICGSSNETFLMDGFSNLTLQFDGEAILNAAMNGPYLVQMVFADPYYSILWSGDYWTGNYTWDQFSNPIIPPPPPPPGPISFAPPHSGYPVDTDSDSLYELFLVNVTVNVTEPGWYYVVGVLRTPTVYWSSGVWDSVLSLHEVGVNVTVLTFTAADICYYGLDGAYSVSLELYTQNSTKLSTMEWYLGNYSVASFDHGPNTHLEAISGDHGLDANGDGLFEYLVLTIQIDVTAAGTYGLLGWVNWIMTNATGPSKVVLDLALGIQTVELMFRGDLFADSGVNGSYLIYVELMDATFNQWFGTLDHYTNNYTHDQFSSGTGASFGFPHDDASLDVNGDGAMEYMAVYANVSVEIPGIYNVSAELSVFVDIIDVAWNRTYLAVGNWSVELLFSGETIKATKWNGSYPIPLELRDADGVLLWSSSHYTHYYTWIVFAKPPIAAAVATRSGDSGTDFTLNASVSSVEAVIYEVRWDFNNDGIWDTVWLSVPTIEHEFPGPGDYVVVLEIRDARGLTDRSSILVTVLPDEINPPATFVAKSRLPEVLISIAGLSVVCLVVVMIAWPVESFLVALAALLLPLYSRLREDDVLDNYRRGMIHGLLLVHPGTSFSEMKEALSFSSGSLVYHLSILQEKGLVCCRKSGTLMRYYLNGSPISDLLRLGLTDFQIEIVKHVLSKGEATPLDLQTALGASKQTVHYNLKKLVTDGVLASSYAGVHRKYRIASGAGTDISKALGVKGSPEDGGSKTAHNSEEPNGRTLKT